MLRHKGPWKLNFCKEELESIFFWCIVTAWSTENQCYQKILVDDDVDDVGIRCYFLGIPWENWILTSFLCQQFKLTLRQDLRLEWGKSFWIFINQGKASEPEIKTPNPNKRTR